MACLNVAELVVVGTSGWSKSAVVSEVKKAANFEDAVPIDSGSNGRVVVCFIFLPIVQDVRTLYKPHEPQVGLEFLNSHLCSALKVLLSHTL